MSNHYHVILRIDKEQTDNWSFQEVCEHWHVLFSGDDLSNRYLSGESLTRTDNKRLQIKCA